MKRILITGGAGFIGSHLANSLAENKEYEVYAIDKQKKNKLNDAVKFSFVDLREESDVNDYFNGNELFDYVFHFASEVSVTQSMAKISKFFDNNIYGTSVLLSALSKYSDNIKQIILASSMAAYGEATIQTNEDHPLCPVSFYGMTKKHQEDMLLLFCKQYNIPYTIFRYFGVYGSGQDLDNPYTGVIAIFLSCLLNNRKITIFEDGKQCRDFIYIDDVINITKNAIINKKMQNSIFNVGAGNITSIIELAEMMCMIYGVENNIEITNNKRAGDVRYGVSDIRKLAEHCDPISIRSLFYGLTQLINEVRK